MKNTFQNKLGTLAIVITCALAGCDNAQVQTSQIAQPDACAVALSLSLQAHSLSDARSSDQRIARLQTLIKNSDNPTYFEQLGWAYISKARSDSDPGFYTVANYVALCMAERNIDIAASLLLRAHVQHQHHAFKQAEALARELVELRGYWFDYAVLGDAQMEQGKIDEAIDSYQKMIDQKPGPQTYARVAHVRWLTGDVQGAAEIMQMAVAASGSRDSESAAWWRTRLAQYLWQLNNPSEADKQLRVALDVFPHYPPALLLKGRMLLAQGNTHKAVAVLQHANAQTPLPEYQWALVEALQLAGYAMSARTVQEEMGESAVLEDPRTYALFLATTGNQLNRAVQLAEDNLQQRQDPFTLDAFAWALRSTGRLEESNALIQRALAQGTQDARLFLPAGVIAAETNQPETASMWFEKTYQLAHMLLPSERNLLDNQIAATKPFIQPSPDLSAI